MENHSVIDYGLGAQVATNFGDLTTHASLHFTGKASFIKDGSSQDNGGNQGGGNNEELG